MYFSKILVLQSGRNPGNGQVVLFGLGYDYQVYCTYPMDPPDPAGWICIGGSVFELQGSLNSSGDLELFSRDMKSDQQVWHTWQDKSSPTGWHDWVSLGHPGLPDQ